MTETRIKISSIVENQLPNFVIEEFPLVSEFLKQYYISLENQGNTSDLLQNIDQYIKIDHLTNLVDSTTLVSDVTFFDSTINVDSTSGFPDSYGLILIDSEIITYTSKTSTSFNGCVRGFSGTTSYKVKDELIFTESESAEHTSGTTVQNLSILFLKEFLIKIKKQITPGFEDRQLYSELNQRLFLKQAIDFYSSKGTDSSFKILFGALYGQNVEVLKPRDNLIQPSDAQYRITSDLVVESLEGNPEDLVNSTLYQDKTGFIDQAQGTITKVEKIIRNGKTYYLISLDSDYNKDIEPIGTVYGKFTIHPKTKATSIIFANSDTLEVDSTVGFPTNNGNLIVDLENGGFLNISYTSKTLTQFLGCSGITSEISESTEIKLDAFAYGYSSDEQIKLRILGVLSDIEIPQNTYLYSKNDNIKIKTLGIDLNDLKSNNWFFNVPTSYDVKLINLLDSSDNSYKINLYDIHSFKVGDSITLISSVGFEQTGYVIAFNNEKTFSIRFGSEQSPLNENLSYIAKKNLSKTNSKNYLSVNKYLSNVQNVYFDSNDNSLYVAAPSLPTYLNRTLEINDRSVEFSGNFSGTTLEIGIHGFYTGDSIVYKPTTGNSLGISTGVYFIKKISDTEVKLARSRSNIFTENFVSVDGTVKNAKFELSDFTFRDLSTQLLESQKLIRKIALPEDGSKAHETDPGLTGIFVNGVEVLNYKSKDNVYYGSIQKIIPTSSGLNYDVINPPTLTITDPIGFGASGYCSVIGNLERMDIIDPGFDYIEEPIIDIRGGNGFNASAKAKLVSFDYQVSFNSNDSAGLVKLNPTNTIGFSSHHKFRDAEEVVYITDGQPSVSGLSTNSTYFISVQNSSTIKLHYSLDDARSGINTIQLTSYGTGNHSFKCVNKKKKIGSIVVENKGQNYQNKFTSTNSAGINTASNTINIPDHGYKSGEIVKYDAVNIPISGLTSSSSYYVTKINDNEFKLSQIGVGTLGITTSFYYDSRQYINLISSGEGVHKFNYPEIVVSVTGRIGVSTLTGQDFNATLQPIFRGSIQSVFLESGGNNYGSEEILNYNRQPLFELNSGSGIELKPIIYNGTIVDVLVNSSGSGYNSPPNLEVIGDGAGAVLTPILSNGSLSEVKIIHGGIGYNEKNTSIIVTSAGNGAKFEAQIQSWKINLVERAIQTSKITQDDGILASGLNADYGLEYTHAYAPRNLRSSVQGTYFKEGKKTFIPDLQLFENKEINSIAHSPIIGWAYDGNPIYGPYGYSSKSGGLIKCLKSGYKLKLKQNRPSFSIYPQGLFVEDYTYENNGDLDEHNGRFCITPEYPNGIYAYFTTINDSNVESNGIFENYKKPIFPYVIGSTYKSKPIDFNFDTNSSQDFIDINKTNWLRNTTPYNLLSDRSTYDYLFNPNKVKSQNSIIKSTSFGSIDSVGIITGGKDYKINDELKFNSVDKSGYGAKAKVSLIKGKPVSHISYETIEIDNVQLVAYNSFIGITSSSHDLNDDDVVTFVTNKEFKNTKGKIKLLKSSLNLRSNLEPTSITGIITDVKVSGNLNEPQLTANSLFQNKDEIIKILDIDKNKSSIKIERNQNATVGVNTNYVGYGITEKSTKFIIDFGISTSTYNFTRNKQIYFDAEKYVGLGSQYGVGISSTLFIDVSKFRSKVAIGTGSTTFLYFYDYKDSKKYKINDYVELVDSSNISFNTTQKQVVSVGNTFIVIDFDSSALSGIGVTSYVNRLDIVKVPTKSIRLPKHNLKPDTPIVYVPPSSGNPIGIGSTSISGIGITNKLPGNIELFPIIVDEDTIGIATVPNSGIDKGFFFSDPGSNNQFTGQIHSFKTNYTDNETNYKNILNGKIVKHVVTVSTAETHGLSLLDTVIISAKPGITTNIYVKYNDYNRRLIINPRNFSSIDTTKNTITIVNHGYRTGQKVLYTSNTPATGLTSQNLYYVISVDSNTIMLSETYYGATKIDPDIIDITSSTAGTISAINPPINIVKNQSIIFDLSDESLSFIGAAVTYSAFDFKIYTDSQFTNEFDSTRSSQFFEVAKEGNIGIDTTARVTLTINDNLPINLYYKLVPINVDINNQIKKDIIIDDEILGANKISIIENNYNGKHTVVGVSSTSFQFNVTEKPQFELLNSSSSKLEYYTESRSAKGSIQNVSITNNGKYYTSLPGITTVISNQGSGAILVPISTSIGKITSTEIQDIGFDYSCDYSVRPTSKIPDILSLESLSSFERIGISSVGRNYNSAPSLIVVDGLTNNVVDDVNLKYSLGDSEVTIIRNTSSLSNVTPKIIPTNNSNGITISNIVFNNTTKDVTVTLGASFSSYQDFPFEIGSKVLIEGVSVGIATTGRGYNSSNYNYTLFTIKTIDPNIGGIGATVSYSLLSYLNVGEIPGNFSSFNSSGKIIPESHFPIFNPTIKKNDFYIGEIVYSSTSEGNVEYWDPINQYLKVSGVGEFNLQDTIKGKTSGSVGIIKNVVSFNSSYKIDSISSNRKGWNKETGFLNNDFQRTHDSDYYQYFSYALKAYKDFNTWNDPVSSLNHTVGFKKFNNLILESESDYVGMSTQQNEGDLVGISDLSSIVSLNCTYDFDLARENNLNLDGFIKSNEISFNSAIIQDYIESIGNRVLSVDDLSSQFNSNPRPTRFSIVDSFILEDFRSKKYFAFVRDKRYSTESQFGLITLIHDNFTGFLNQYGIIDSMPLSNLGFFDFTISGTEGNLLFYPFKFKLNDYHVELLSFTLKDIVTGVGSTSINLGDAVRIGIQTTTVPTGTIAGSSVSVVGIASTYRSSKVLVQIGATDSSYYEYDEITYVHDGTNVYFIDYGQITTDSSSSKSSVGIGTYNAYISGSDVQIDLILNDEAAIGYDINTFNVSIGNSNASGIGTQVISGGSLNSSSKTIASSGSPVANTIASYSNANYNSAYLIISIEDKTNLKYQVSEFLVFTNTGNCYINEFGILRSSSSLGITTAGISGSNTNIYFTPISNIDVDIKIFKIDLGLKIESSDISFDNGSIGYKYGSYTGTNNDVKKSFNLTYNNLPIFKRSFDASSSSIIDVNNDIIQISNHFYTTGEEIIYSYPEDGISQPIGIATTTIPGIGSTDKLPSSLYVVKLNDLNIQVSASASDSLKTIPNVLDLTSVGIGTSHVFTSKNQNQKVLISIDNIIQSPVVSSSVTSLLVNPISVFESEIYLTGIGSIYGGDLIKIDEEIMKVASVGIASTNSVSVLRPWLGTGISSHVASSLVTKVSGNYNITDNIINFTESPFGKVPFINQANRPDELDYIGIATGSSFDGRVFLRSGVPNSLEEAYERNYTLDDISSDFDATKKTFTLKSNQSNITGISTDNAIILINGIFQGPDSTSVNGDYDLSESAGITSVTFTGIARSTDYDVNVSSIPRGGIILSVASTAGFGYQPLVSAGGTAIVSISGTIQSISIGNTGSGYRSGIQKTIKVGVRTENLESSSIEFIGTASVSNGHIVSVAITNPGSGYTSTNPPVVVFDSPLSYTNIPLIYSSQSVSGLGSAATVDIVVGQGSSVISLELKNLGYGYKPREILTVAIGGTTGIPTTSSGFSEFQITVDNVQYDQFNGWTIGNLQILDSLDELFDGQRTRFPILIDGNQTTIRSKKGSNVEIQSTLLIFINDILQIPGSSYIFNGGSIIKFTEAPKKGDTSKLLFYRGTGEVDTIFVDILENIKVGDTVSLNSDDEFLKEDDRLVTEIVSSDTLNTNLYPGPGISEDEDLLRPLTWCKQTDDLIINGKQIGKNRISYEPYIQPTTNIIQSVGIGSTIIYVESVKTFFDSEREYLHDGTNEKPQNKIIIISQDSLVTAAATANVSTSGTISSLSITENGVGYSTNPTISISNPIGIGTSGVARATSTIINGSVSTVSISTGGFGYDSSNPPVVLFESPKPKYETINEVSYEGDFGIITGIKTTSVGVASTGIVFDLYVPQNSFLRDGKSVKVGIATTGLSGIQTGYYFVINKSNVGNAVTSLTSSGSIVGIGTTFLDNIYQAVAVSIAQTAVPGVGITNVTKVTVSVSNYNNLTGLGFSGYYGEYSWGRILIPTRVNPQEFVSYNSGISTSPIVQRFTRLKYIGYSTT